MLNLEKCQFFRDSVDFLGLQVSAEGVAPLPGQVSAVLDFPRPSSIRELQGFLGAVNFYRQFIPSAAEILLPLTVVLKGGGSGRESLTWSGEMKAAFTRIKAALARTACLVFPSAVAELSLATDASAVAVGAVLQQREPGREDWRPLVFFSKKLEKAKLNYSTFDRELLAVYLAIKHFRHQLEGHQFQVWTDHNTLTFVLKQISDNKTTRQQR